MDKYTTHTIRSVKQTNNPQKVYKPRKTIHFIIKNIIKFYILYLNNNNNTSIFIMRIKEHIVI